MKLSDFRGRVVVVSFWATWCGPCMGPVPHEREMVKRLGGKPLVCFPRCQWGRGPGTGGAAGRTSRGDDSGVPGGTAARRVRPPTGGTSAAGRRSTSSTARGIIRHKWNESPGAGAVGEGSLG